MTKLKGGTNMLYISDNRINNLKMRKKEMKDIKKALKFLRKELKSLRPELNLRLADSKDETDQNHYMEEVMNGIFRELDSNIESGIVFSTSSTGRIVKVTTYYTF